MLRQSTGSAVAAVFLLSCCACDNSTAPVVNMPTELADKLLGTWKSEIKYSQSSFVDDHLTDGYQIEIELVHGAYDYYGQEVVGVHGVYRYTLYWKDEPAAVAVAITCFLLDGGTGSEVMIIPPLTNVEGRMATPIGATQVFLLELDSSDDDVLYLTFRNQLRRKLFRE